jgi:hypothetical protein
MSSASTWRMVLATQNAAQVASAKDTRLPRLIDSSPSLNSYVSTMIDEGRHRAVDAEGLQREQQPAHHQQRAADVDHRRHQRSRIAGR